LCFVCCFVWLLCCVVLGVVMPRVSRVVFTWKFYDW